MKTVLQLLTSRHCGPGIAPRLTIPGPKSLASSCGLEIGGEVLVGPALHVVSLLPSKISRQLSSRLAIRHPRSTLFFDLVLLAFSISILSMCRQLLGRPITHCPRSRFSITRPLEDLFLSVRSHFGWHSTDTKSAIFPTSKPGAPSAVGGCVAPLVLCVHLIHDPRYLARLVAPVVAIAHCRGDLDVGGTAEHRLAPKRKLLLHLHHLIE